MEQGYWRYWGKARAEADSGAKYHLLPYHCLDVAAVGVVYLLHHADLRADWAARLQITEEALSAWFAFFLTQHDLGKFSYRFQGLRRDICLALGNQQEEGRYHPRHDTLGYLLWEDKIGPLSIEQAWFGTVADRNSRRAWRDNFDIWAKIATGHHGQPPKTTEQRPCLDHLFSSRDQQAALQFATDCADLLLPNRDSALPDGRAVYERLRPLSWWLAGLAVLCDWLGSNRTFFEYQATPHNGDKPLQRYWEEEAKPRAEQALRHYGLLPPTAKAQTLNSLFGFTSPTPLQQTAADLPLPAAPQLFILEDVTGAGKTEAALMLAHRLIASGQADGFYFGLPTMATSNAMFRRIADEDKGVAQKFFQGEWNCVLAHSASRLAPVLEALLSGGNGEGDYEGRDEQSAANERLAWFSDNRKKALLADVGIGTVDQALLAVLYSRHQSLRLLGLARKVLVVDEVHSGDEYMLKLLEVLLTFHAASGGSAILLSATLPRTTREKLARAYREGLGLEAPTLPSNQYPLLTRISFGNSDEIPLETRPEVARTVAIDWVYSVESAVEILLAARTEGRCACWIRNTVDDAIAAFGLLQQAGVSAEGLILFHARFALGDRLKIEDLVLNTFGPESTAAERYGKILICTQVVESSVDIDMDIMLSDLAPVDLLIQRAGRLCRHVRDASSNRSPENGRGIPKLWLFAPEFTETPATAWLVDPMPGTAAVYPDHGRLWLTARLLRESGKLAMPGDARKLIEGVYGLEAEASIPSAFQSKTNKVEGEKSAKQSVAAANTLTLERGYEDAGFDPWDDTLIPTRLEDVPSATVRLGRWESGEVKPWIAAPKFAWELSQLSVRVSLLAEEMEAEDPAMQEAIKRCREQMPDKGKWSKLLVLRQADGSAWVGQARSKKGEVASLAYDERMGLRRV